MDAWGYAAFNDLGHAREQLLTDYIYRLPTVRLAQAQHAAGGQAHLLMLGGVNGASATHGSDVPALVGKSLPDASGAVRDRDNRIMAVVAAFIRGDQLPWAPTGEQITAHGINITSSEASTAYATVLDRWKGIPRN